MSRFQRPAMIRNPNANTSDRLEVCNTQECRQFEPVTLPRSYMARGVFFRAAREPHRDYVIEGRLSRNWMSPYAPEKAPLLRGRKTSTLRLDVHNPVTRWSILAQEFQFFDGT